MALSRAEGEAEALRWQNQALKEVPTSGTHSWILDFMENLSLVGGLEHDFYFPEIFGIIIPIDYFFFQRG